MKEYRIVFNDLSTDNPSPYLVILKMDTPGMDAEDVAREIQKISDTELYEARNGVKDILGKYRGIHPELHYTMISVAGVCYGR